MTTLHKMMTTPLARRSIMSLAVRRTYASTSKMSGIAAWSPTLGYQKFVTAPPLNVCYVRPKSRSLSSVMDYFFKQVFQQGKKMK
mmetsp:Transcript_25386/g.48106  ORF Transcript_25386/g.48106 Transcript_25386/m.48106 type:complete len:85 (-) Transcript_25386:233-487(-)